jgi:hypothetical protein
MPRYFFHGPYGPPDDDGAELADLRAAQAEAVRRMAGAMADMAGEVWGEQPSRLIVTDHTGLILLVLDLSGFVTPALHDDPRG